MADDADYDKPKLPRIVANSASVEPNFPPQTHHRIDLPIESRLTALEDKVAALEKDIQKLRQ